MSGNTLPEGERELWRNAQWRVTKGLLEQVDHGDRLGSPYWISLADLARPGLVEHVCSKTWVNAHLFIEAYRRAAEVAGMVPDEGEMARAVAGGVA